MAVRHRRADQADIGNSIVLRADITQGNPDYAVGALFQDDVGGGQRQTRTSTDPARVGGRRRVAHSSGAGGFPRRRPDQSLVSKEQTHLDDPEQQQAAVEDAPVTLKLSHAEASKNLRLTFALCYATVQGRTLRDKHIVLLDTRRHFFTMRHLIVGLSRATAGRFVHVQSKRYQDEGRLLTVV